MPWNCHLGSPHALGVEAPFSLAAVGIPPPVPQGGREPLGPPSCLPNTLHFQVFMQPVTPYFDLGGWWGVCSGALCALPGGRVFCLWPLFTSWWPFYGPFIAPLWHFCVPLMAPLSPFREVVPLFGVGLLFAADLLAEGEWPSALPAATKSSHARWSSPASQHTGLM
jgi:hypothetical protein